MKLRLGVDVQDSVEVALLEKEEVEENAIVSISVELRLEVDEQDGVGVKFGEPERDCVKLQVDEGALREEEGEGGNLPVRVEL